MKGDTPKEIAMVYPARAESVLSWLSLGRTRRLLHRPRYRLLAASIAGLYAFGSMLLGQMLVFSPTHQLTPFVEVVYTGTPWWNYPGLVVVAPNAILALAFLPTIFMVLISIGVGIGGAAAVRLFLPIFQRGARRSELAVSGAAAGSAPAITGMATLGACCCTGCAGAAGVAVVAAASGSSVNSLLQNDWYIGLFQLGVVTLSLLAQERSLRMAEEGRTTPPHFDRRFAIGALLRVALLIAGITWSLAMLAEWADVNPVTAPASTWYHWIFEHQLLSWLAIAAGLFPRELSRLVIRSLRALPLRATRVGALVAGVTWGTWVPPALTALGLGGFLNELLGYLGVSAAWGAIPPDSAVGLPLLFHWSFQHLLLSGFAVAFAMAPLAALRPLLWSADVDRAELTSEAASDGTEIQPPKGTGPSVPSAVDA